MKISHGLQNEIDLIKAFNHKRVSDLNSNLSNVSKYILPKINRNARFRAKKCSPISKPDIVLIYKLKKYYISIKSNSSCYLHQEKIKDFILYLRNFGISELTQKVILLFQYGDDTLDGTGKIRYNFKEIIKRYGNLIKEANKELNSNKELVLNFLDKAMFSGNVIHKEKAGFIYHGDINNGVICSKKSVTRFVSRRKFDQYQTLHIGPITMSPYARYTMFNDLYPEKRQLINFSWKNLSNTLVYINKYFDS